MESVIIQVAASLVKGMARIKPKQGKSGFNKKLAMQSWKSLVKTHQKYGWVTAPLTEG